MTADTPDARGSLFVNADWSSLVPAGSPEAAYGITPQDATSRGLLPLKEAAKPADKMLRKPANKAVRKRRSK